MPIRVSLLSTTMLSGVVGGIFLSTMTAQATDLITKATPETVVTAVPMPAVDGINGKIDGFGGTLADRSIYGSRGALSIPLAGPYGLQIDGALGSFDNRFFGDVAGHLFWRDPSIGSVGLYGAYTHWDEFSGLNAQRIAAEGAWYSGRWTVNGIAGVEGGNSASAVVGPFIETFDVKTRFFDKVDVSYYITDNLKVYGGHRYLGGLNAAAFGAEWAYGLGHGTQASLFVEGRAGESDFHGVWGGLRFYFGQHDKTLIERHRQDDPPIWSPDNLYTITNSLSTVAVPPPTTTTSGSSGSSGSGPE